MYINSFGGDNIDSFFFSKTLHIHEWHDFRVAILFQYVTLHRPSWFLNISRFNSHTIVTGMVYWRSRLHCRIYDMTNLLFHGEQSSKRIEINFPFLFGVFPLSIVCSTYVTAMLRRFDPKSFRSQMMNIPKTLFEYLVFNVLIGQLNFHYYLI